MINAFYSSSIWAMEPSLITVETDIRNGIPMFNMVGLADITINEAKERIRAALSNSGYKFPNKRITVNLAPADVHKSGTGFDLPIAIGLLSYNDLNEGLDDERYEMLEYIKKNFAFIGELSLSGKLVSVHGALALALGVRNAGVKNIVVPAANVDEVKVLTDINVYGFSHLNEVMDFIRGDLDAEPEDRKVIKKRNTIKRSENFSQVYGQELVKRAITIAVAGHHGILMVGSPGVGKTMIANRIPSIMPDIKYDEMLEVAKIYSVSDVADINDVLCYKRPFRKVSSGITESALFGGGNIPKPGEISLAHSGVLFIDEFAQFAPSLIEQLRGPMEDKVVKIQRRKGVFTFPSDFMFVAASNPCKCGYLGDDTRECTCSAKEISNVASRFSGPILDRVDIHVRMNNVKFKDLKNYNQVPDEETKSSEDMRMEIDRALSMQKNRYAGEGIVYNSQMSESMIKKYCVLHEKEKRFLENAYNVLKISPRSLSKVVKVARTIADMEMSENIRVAHISEAIGYRALKEFYREKA